MPVIFKNDGKNGHVKVCLLFFVLIILQDVANLEKRETTGRTQPLESSRHRLFSLRFHISTLHARARARTHVLCCETHVDLWYVTSPAAHRC